MNGDLGNLLTGEMGEAESRFAYDDFAEAYGRRVAGRVRRRRAVRAAGVGGGTMLTAGALAIGATHVPWGALGAAAGVGGSDCVTPSPSDVVSTYSAAVSTDHGSAWEILFLDAASGSTILRGAQQPDGTYRFTDGDGNPLSATPGVAGYYTVELPAGVHSLESTSITTVLGGETNAGSSFSVPSVAGPVEPTPSASDDCYTPSPTPSVAPSLSVDNVYKTDPSPAAKPEDVTSPFQCGSILPTESYGNGELWIDGVTWMDGADAAAAIRAKFADDTSQAPEIRNPTGKVPVVTAHFASTISQGGMSATLGSTEPSLIKITQDLATATTDLSASDKAKFLLASEGATFVGVADGRIVATMKVPAEGSTTDPSVYTDWRSPEDGSLMYLLDQGAALTSCSGSPVDLAQVDIVAVAGVIVEHPDGTMVGPTYAWLPVGTP